MQIDLSQKTAVVTGSTDGIGYAIAAGLARAGAEVVITGRTQPRVEEAAARLAAVVPGAQARGVAVDLSEASGCATLARAVPQADILVNNVGAFEVKPFLDIPDEDWEHLFQLNVMSGVRLSRAYLPGMLERDWGRIIFISSESGLNIPVEMIHYGVTKTAILAVSRGLAKVAAGSNVTVNAVLPGPTRTAGVDAMLREAAEEAGQSIEEVGADFVKTARPSSLLGRMASPEEAANLVVYVCSPQASATTGAALRVEGGIVDTIA